MRENKVKKALAEGKVVIGTMISEVRGPGIMTMLATAGYDYVIIDMEHSFYSMETVSDMMAAAKATDMYAFVRTAGLSRLSVAQPLDMGAEGVLIPQTETLREAHDIINYAKYSPMGQRGMAMRRAHSNFAKVNAAEYIKDANNQTLIILQIESKLAMENLEELVSVEGVDAAFIGPSDLSQSYGLPGQFNNAKIQEDVMRYIDVCNEHGVAPGIHCFDLEAAKKWIDAGMRLICFQNDINMIVDTATGYTTELKGYLNSKK